ncbi:MAG TPA: hypothetical protein DIS98_00510 [Colwellia sp.]|nr:hypothetical protein [Colwellia sp.]|tara:strand:- start:476 stop:727 length:252 start_codon:yes stop_codon:yes gene_type:complete
MVLTQDVCQIILQHHDRHFISEFSSPQEQDLFAVLKLSEQLIYLKSYDCATADLPYVQENVCKVLAIDDETLQALVSEFTESE